MNTPITISMPAIMAAAQQRQGPVGYFLAQPSKTPSGLPPSWQQLPVETDPTAQALTYRQDTYREQLALYWETMHQHWANLFSR